MAIVKGESFADALEEPASADEKLVDYLMDLCEIVNSRLDELGMNRSTLPGSSARHRAESPRFFLEKQASRSRQSLSLMQHSIST